MDELAQAQQSLGRSIDRARAGEDPQLAGTVREKGEQMVGLLFGLLRTSRAYAPDNPALNQPVAELEIKHLRDLARVVAGQHGKASAVLGPALKPLAAPYTLQKLLATVPPGQPAPDALVELLDLLARYGADLFDPLFDRLGSSIAAATHKTDPMLETLAMRAA